MFLSLIITRTILDILNKVSLLPGLIENKLIKDRGRDNFLGRRDIRSSEA